MGNHPLRQLFGWVVLFADLPAVKAVSLIATFVSLVLWAAWGVKMLMATVTLLTFQAKKRKGDHQSVGTDKD